MSPHRPRLLALVTSLFVLAACSGTDGDRSSAASPGSPTPGVTATGAPFTVPGFPTYADPAMLQTVSVTDDAAVVRHSRGQVTIPRKPQRVYADPSAFAIASALGLPLVAVDYYPGSEIYPHFRQSVAGADALPLKGEANAERIADSFAFWQRAIRDLSTALTVGPGVTAALDGFAAKVDGACCPLPVDVRHCQRV